MNSLQPHIEAILFASDQPLEMSDLRQSLSRALGLKPSEEEIDEALGALQEKFSSDDFSFEPVFVGGGWQFFTKKKFQPTVQALIEQKSQRKLSNATLETLAIIAYRQPVSKPEIEAIRGVNCDFTIQKLLEKELIAISGRGEGAGKPILYKTSQLFMDYFGLNSQSDLPKLKEIEQMMDNVIGTPTELSEESSSAAEENAEQTTE